MKLLVCETNQRNEFPFYGDRLSGKIVHRIKIVKKRVWGNHLRGAKSPDKAPSCLEKLLGTKGRETKKCWNLHQV